MAAADHGRPGADYYQLIGVARGAPREQIAQAWRRRARAEHPDSRPADAAAPGRFRALAEAYRVLSDPARRAAYDRALARAQQPAARAPTARLPVRWLAGPAGLGDPDPGRRAPGPPLRAGPVWVDGAYLAPAGRVPDERDIGLAILANLALRYLARDRDWPW